MWKVFLILLVALSPAETLAAPNVCEGFHKNYKAATKQVATALQRYADCVDNGEPTEGCLAEFSRLRTAHRLLEISTSNFARYCSADPRATKRY